jgi:hypothetical protein
MTPRPTVDDNRPFSIRKHVLRRSAYATVAPDHCSTDAALFVLESAGEDLVDGAFPPAVSNASIPLRAYGRRKASNQIWIRSSQQRRRSYDETRPTADSSKLKAYDEPLATIGSAISFPTHPCLEPRRGGLCTQPDGLRNHPQASLAAGIAMQPCITASPIGARSHRAAGNEGVGPRESSVRRGRR